MVDSSTNVDRDEWMYSSNADKKGPVPTGVLLKLIDRRIIDTTSTLVWKGGMVAWQPIQSVPPFHTAIQFQNKQWYYIDSNGTQKGPLYSGLLMHKLDEGDIDGLTMVFGNGLKEWTKIAEVEELKTEIMRHQVEKQDAEEKRALLASAAANENDQIFVADDELPSEARETFNELYKKSIIDGDGKDTSSSSSSGSIQTANLATIENNAAGTKSFVADNGLTYFWDEEEQDWVEDDGESYEAAAEALTGTGSGSGVGTKRKDDTVEDDDGDGDGNGTTASSEKKEKRKRSKKKSKKGPSNWVYVSGLPGDVTIDEIKHHFSKVGLIEISPYDQQPKIKVYREELDINGEGRCKGDAMLCFNSDQSMKLAIEVLDGGYIRPDNKISVSKADFGKSVSDGSSSSSNGNNGANKAKRPVLTQAQVKVARAAMKQALTWNENDDIGVSNKAALKIVVLEGMFSPSDFDIPTFQDELEHDIAIECENKCGPIEKLTLFSKHLKGVVIVKFGTSYAAQECVNLMNGRFFGGRKVRSYFWDGVTNYTMTDSYLKAAEEEEKKEESRLDEFGDWLDKDQEELPAEFQLRTE